MKLLRLSGDAFDLLADTTRIKPHARALAREVLVDGRNQVDVANEAGMTKQRVNLAVGVIERAYERAEPPVGAWVSVELAMPGPLAIELAALMAAMKGSDADKAQRAADTVYRALASARRVLRPAATVKAGA